jgi:hypothetical protein
VEALHAYFWEAKGAQKRDPLKAKLIITATTIIRGFIDHNLPDMMISYHKTIKELVSYSH